MAIPSRWTVAIPHCSLQQWIFHSATGALPDTRAHIDPDQAATHYTTIASYRLLSKRFALGFLREGLKPNDRVLVFSGNHLYYPALFLGILMARGIFTGANPSYVVRELAYQLRDSGATMLVVAEAVLETGLAAAEEVGIPWHKIFVLDAPLSKAEADQDVPGQGKRGGRSHGTRLWTDLLAGTLGEARQWSWHEPGEEAASTICCLNYSSGTTGPPKGVVITHYAYVANGQGVLLLQHLSPDFVSLSRRARGLCFLPMYHAFSQTYFIANYPRLHWPVYVMPTFSFDKMVSHVARYRITNLICVPPIMLMLAKNPLARATDLSSVESITCGAAPLAQEVASEVEALFLRQRLQGQPDETVAFLPVRQGWGMTELTCSCTGFDPAEKHLASVSGGRSVGEVMANCALRLVDPETQTEILEPDVAGEVWVTGPTLMQGYWNRPEATEASFFIDSSSPPTRWFRTGDMGLMEGHYGPGAKLLIVDRLKELIKVKGNQVAPAELEALLLERRDVADAAVVGVTVHGDEVPRAYVVTTPGSEAVSEKDIIEWVAARVAPFKRLKGGVRFVDAVPKNPSGKILRRQLREMAKREVGDRPAPASKLS